MSQAKEINIINGLDTDVLKETVSNVENQPELGKCRFRATNKWLGGGHNCTTITSFYGAGQEMSHKQAFELHADEPPILAGQDSAANPVEHLLNALASCMTTSMVAHAAVRGIQIDEVESEIEGDIDLRGFLGLSEDVPKGYTNIRIKFKVKSDVNDMDKLKSLVEFSPVYNTIINGANVDIQIEPK